MIQRDVLHRNGRPLPRGRRRAEGSVQMKDKRSGLFVSINISPASGQTNTTKDVCVFEF